MANRAPDRAVHTNSAVAHRAPDDARVDRLIDGILLALHRSGRRAIRVVDAGCGRGAPLMRVAEKARAFGFVAIEARGVDHSADRIRQARLASSKRHDAAIGLTFETAEIALALAGECDCSVDILLCDRGALARQPVSLRRHVAREARRVADHLILTGGRSARATEEVQ